MREARFKIAYSDNYRFPFGLFYLRPRAGWKPGGWVMIDYFPTKDDAKKLYEAIKDLPEYLQ